jgi:hypothetical protein
MLNKRQRKIVNDLTDPGVNYAYGEREKSLIARKECKDLRKDHGSRDNDLWVGNFFRKVCERVDPAPSLRKDVAANHEGDEIRVVPFFATEVRVSHRLLGFKLDFDLK